jgi:hypothetical protein
VGIAKDLKRTLEAESQERAAVPWWMGLTTIERAVAMSREIEGQLESFKQEHRAFEEALTRLGFAGHAAKRPRGLEQ